MLVITIYVPVLFLFGIVLIKHLLEIRLNHPTHCVSVMHVCLL